MFLFQDHLPHRTVFSVPEKHRCAHACLWRREEVSHVQVLPVSGLPGKKHSPPSSLLRGLAQRVRGASQTSRRSPKQMLPPVEGLSSLTPPLLHCRRRPRGALPPSVGVLPGCWWKAVPVFPRSFSPRSREPCPRSLLWAPVGDSLGTRPWGRPHSKVHS